MNNEEYVNQHSIFLIGFRNLEIICLRRPL